MSRALQIVNIGGVDDNRFVLGNAMIARKLDLTPHIALPHNWQRIRWTFRVSFDDFGGDVLDEPKFFVGMMTDPAAGMSNGPLTNSTNHCFRMRTGDTTWSRAAGPPARYTITGTNAWKPIRKVGSTETVLWGYTPNGNVPADPLYRAVFLMEFARSGTNILMSQAVNSTQDFPVVTEETLRAALARETFAGAITTLGVSMNTIVSGGSFPGAEAANGNLNSLFFSWDRVSPKCYISECFYSIFAS